MRSRVVEPRRRDGPLRRYFTDDSMLRRVVGDRVTACRAARAARWPRNRSRSRASSRTPARSTTLRPAGAHGHGDERDRVRQPRAGRPPDGEVRAMQWWCAASSRRPRPVPPARTAATTPSTCCGSSPRLPESAMLVYASTPARSPRRARRAVAQDYRVVGRLFGLRERDMPADIEAFEAYMAEPVRELGSTVTPQARELAIDIVLRPPVPLHLRPVLELVNQITVGCRRGARAVRLPLGPGARRRAARRREYVSAWWCPCCPSGCGCPPLARARRQRIAGQLAVHAAPDPERVLVAQLGREQRRGRVLPGDRAQPAADRGHADRRARRRVVAGYGPPWCMPCVTATPVGKPS